MTIKSVALVAHDHKKPALIKWAISNKSLLENLTVYATGTTGKLISEALGIDVHKLLSGPLGGDQQLGARIAEGKIDLLIFFWDPLEPMPHDPDIKALLRIAAVWNIPLACNQASADYIIHSRLIQEDYQRDKPDFNLYLERTVA